MKKETFSPSSGSSLNTLGLSGTTPGLQTGSQPLIIVRGNGTELSSKGMESWAKRKAITLKTILSLIDIATLKGAKDRVKAYWNTYHCLNRVYTAGGKLYGKYCKNRFCTLCSGIRKAELINKYLPVIQNWEEPYFVTLTVKAVPANGLSKIMKGVLRAFRIIKDRYRKKHQRGKGGKFMGLKSLECNFNPRSRTYNPHLHLIVPNKELADILVNEWLALWTKKYTNRGAQHYRKVSNKEKDLVEVIKYGSKIFTEPGSENKKGKKASAYVYAAALDSIYKAMKGCQIFGKFGFNLPAAGKRKKGGEQLLNQYQEWKYDPQYADWVTIEHESTLVGYTLPAHLAEILEFNIDSELE